MEALTEDSVDLEAAGKKTLMQRIDGLGTASCVLVGFAEGLLIIKNIPLGISAGVGFGAAGLPGSETVLMILVFAVIAGIGGLLPLVASMVGGDRVQRSLHDARHWIEANMAAITLVVLILVGGIFLGEGLGL